MKISLSTWILACGSAGAVFASSPGWGDPGPIVLEKILCEGNVRTSCEYLIGQTNLQIGQTLEDDALQTAKYRLRLLGNFTDADLKLSKGEQVGKAVLTISVVEASPYTAYISALVSNPWAGFNALLDTTWIDKNLTGRNDPLSLRFRLGNDNRNDWRDSSNRTVSARLEYTRPFASLPRMFWTAGTTFALRDHSDRYGGPFQNTFRDTALLADLALGYRIFDYSYISAGGSFGRTWYDQPIGELRGNYYSSPGSDTIPGFFLQYGYDSQDDPNFPTRGSKLQLLFSFDRLFADQNGYKSDTLRLDLAYRKHFEIADAHVLTLELGQFRSNDRQAVNEFDPILGLRYAHYFKRHASGDLVKNGGFYLEPGVFFNDPGTYAGFGSRALFGGRVGVGLETSLGMVNFSFVAGTQ